MSAKITDKQKTVIEDKGSYKSVASVSKNGNIELTGYRYTGVDDNGNLLIYQLLQTSQSNRNLTYALWFNKEVTIHFSGSGSEEFTVRGIPVRNIVAGPFFEKKYIELNDEDFENDLVSIYVIEPSEISENNYEVLRQKERSEWGILGHMDRDLVSKEDHKDA